MQMRATYQTLLSAHDSRQIFSALRPSLVVSGDDHHPCAHLHTLPPCPGSGRAAPFATTEAGSSEGGGRGGGAGALFGELGVWEHTLATVSFLQGNVRPGMGVIEWDPHAPLHGCPPHPPPSAQRGEKARRGETGGGCGAGTVDIALRQCWLPRNLALLAWHSMVAALAAVALVVLQVRDFAAERALALSRGSTKGGGGRALRGAGGALCLSLLFQICAVALAAVGGLLLWSALASFGGGVLW
ncbi:hypothetical protein T484DRAFT_1885716 [Baffinella frigidus]|nr:hypothetical protein T484DRAFT_1885716 [Cryptophyta sp. CCMP2293]